MVRIFFSSILLFFLAGCATDGSLTKISDGLPPESLYKKGRENLLKGNYNAAISYYQALDIRFPNHPIVREGDVELAYAYYKNDDPEQAKILCDRFLKIYHNDPHGDYILYLKGVIFLDKNLYPLAHFFKQSPADRDPKTLNDSFSTFKELIKSYPQSIYTSDAKRKLNYISFLLAQHDYNIGVFYFERGAYSSALARFQDVILKYPHTPLKEKTLQFIVKCYEKMGMKEPSESTHTVFLRNYPKPSSQ